MIAGTTRTTNVPLAPSHSGSSRAFFKRLPNWKEVLIWKEEYSEWRKAGSVSDLDLARAMPPPIPRTQAISNQSPNGRGTVADARSGPSRNIVLLVISTYFLAALAFAVFGEMRKPFANWEKLFHPYLIGSTIGAAAGLFIISGLVPVVVWAFRRFRAARASGPLYSWLVLLFIFGGLIAYGQSFELERKFEEIGKTALTGKNRQDFIVAAQRSCTTTQRQDQLNRQAGVTEVQISAYCDCIANALANTLSADEIVFYAQVGKPSARHPAKDREPVAYMLSCGSWQAILGSGKAIANGASDRNGGIESNPIVFCFCKASSWR